MENASKSDRDAQIAVSVFVCDENQQMDNPQPSTEVRPREPLEKEYFCGIRRWHPASFQIFRTAKFFTFILCLYCIIEGALISGFVPSVLSTIERQYNFSSTWAAIIIIVFEIAVIISVLFISYFSGQGHKPRWLGIGLVIESVGSFIFATPQFFFSKYDGKRGDDLEACLQDTHLPSSCSNGNILAYLLFLLGAALIGVGAAPLFTVGTSYIDEIVHPRHSSVHLGVFYMMSVLGPALGFGLGSAFLSIYVNPQVATELTSADHDWVGAWWLCFVFSAAACLVIAAPFFLFPRLLPDSHLVRLARREEMAKRSPAVDQSDDGRSTLRAMPTHLKQVVTNPPWVFITCSTSASLIVLSGLVTFAPKYLESQFKLEAATSSVIAGAIAIPCGSAGVLIGSLIIYCAKLKGRGVALLTSVITLVVIAPSLVFLAQCPNVLLEGVTHSYATNSSSFPSGSSPSRFNSSCNLHCNCTATSYEPVCGDDGVTYFSACYAGCRKQYHVGPSGTQTLSFENCSCIEEQLLQIPKGPSHGNSSATVGVCNNETCSGVVVFLVFIGVTLFLVFIFQVPMITITVRCVAEEQRTLALGLQSIVFRMVGSIPGPLLFGAIFDSACLLWQYDCGTRGQCWVYSNPDISNRAMGLALGGAILAFVFSFLTWVVYPRKAGEEEKEGGTKVELELCSDDVIKKGEGLDVRPVLRMSTTRFDSCRSDDGLIAELRDGGAEEGPPVDGDVTHGNEGQKEKTTGDTNSVLVGTE